MQSTKNYRAATQKKIILSYLNKNIATTKMVSIATGIPIASICKEKRKLEKEGKLVEVKRDLCKVSNHLAYYLSTNKDIVEIHNKVNYD